MENQDSLNTPERRMIFMQADKTSNNSKETLQKKNFVDITRLIRSIQRVEGNPDCFKKAIGDCDRLDCAWRQYCV